MLSSFFRAEPIQCIQRGEKKLVNKRGRAQHSSALKTHSFILMESNYELFECVAQPPHEKEATNNLAGSLQRESELVGIVNTQ